MPNYQVTLRSCEERELEVEADSPEQARIIAENKAEWCFDDGHYYQAIYVFEKPLLTAQDSNTDKGEVC